jgi:cysteine desulfurase
VTSVYLDWNATTPPLPEVIEAMVRASREAWGNPSSVHAVGRKARAWVEDAREAVARLAGCDARDVVLTSGGTEANNLALRSAFVDAGGTLLTSRLEHPSVTRVAEAIEREGRGRVHWARVLGDGTIDLDDVERTLSEGNVKLVALQSANAETGVVQAVGRVLDLARRAGVRVHVDAVQTFGRSDDVGHGADTRSLAGHKIRGPKSIGALVTRPGVPVLPVLFGGSQERGVRPGTIDAVAAAGLGAAARHALTSPARWRALGPLRDQLEAGLLRIAPGARVNGAGATRMPHVSSVAFPGWGGPELVAALDLEGVAVSAGSACSAGTAEPSPVLVAMGDPTAAASSVRFSLGEETRAADVVAALRAAERVFAR